MRTMSCCRLARRRPPKRAMIGLLLVGTSSSLPLQAQDPLPSVRVGEVVAESSVDFTRIPSIRELSDGRVIVVDADLRLVWLLSASLGDPRPLGGRGQGPEEYERPTAVFALRGDTSWVVDAGRARVLIVAPNGDIVGGRRWYGDDRPTTTAPDAIDTEGMLYRRAQPIRFEPDGSMAVVDSAAIVRSSLGSSAGDTVAFLPVELPRGTRLWAGGIAVPPSHAAFPAHAVWAAAGDGAVAIVHPVPYRVEIYGPGVGGRRGSEVAYDPISVSEAHREAWREEQQRPRPVTTFSRSGQGGGVMMRVPEPREPDTWPATLPPFLPGAARFASTGELWVQRTTEADEPPTFDVFDRHGERTGRVVLPNGVRVVGFGESFIYGVRRDSLGREYLLRIR